MSARQVRLRSVVQAVFFAAVCLCLPVPPFPQILKAHAHLPYANASEAPLPPARLHFPPAVPTFIGASASHLHLPSPLICTSLVQPPHPKCHTTQYSLNILQPTLPRPPTPLNTRHRPRASPNDNLVTLPQHPHFLPIQAQRGRCACSRRDTQLHRRVAWQDHGAETERPGRDRRQEERVRLRVRDRSTTG